MGYSQAQFEDPVERFGEVFFVLDSGEMYQVHGKESYSLEWYDDEQFARVEGMRDGEFYIVEFKLDDIEHHYTHREV